MWLILLLSLFSLSAEVYGEPASKNSSGWVSAQVIRSAGTSNGHYNADSTKDGATLKQLNLSNELYSLSLSDAILSAVSSNPEILSLKLAPKRAQSEVLTAEALTDTTVSAQASYVNDISPSSSSLFGSTYHERDGRFDAAVSKQFATGTALDLTWTNSRIRNNALFTTLSPQYAAELRLALTQPLLKGFWSGRPAVLIALRQNESDAIRIEYAAKLSNQVKNVIAAYWNQELSLQEVAVNKRALELAEELLAEADSSVHLGMQAPVSLSDSKAEVAKQREALLSATNRANAAGNELRRITGNQELLAGSGIVKLSEAPQVALFDFSLQDSLQHALSERAELKAQRLKLIAAKQYYEYTKNQTLPQLDLVGAASIDGLAGEPVLNPNFPAAPNSFMGNYGDALDSLGSGDYREYEVGLKITHPLENSAARATKHRAKLDHTAAQYSLTALERSVTLEVSNAVDALESAKQRIDAADSALVFAQESNQVGQQRFKNGLSSSREVLERQRDLAAAELADARAEVDYQISVAELWRARGDLLQHFGIEVNE